MSRVAGTVVICLLFAVQLPQTQSPSQLRERLWRHRNLGKAYYENPMTQAKAVDEFKQALALRPNSTRDRINYGLALLRVGDTRQAILELQRAQKQDPSIPHTWFNLAMAYKKELNHERAVEQFQGMIERVPDEPVSHYNLGVEYKLLGKSDLALQQFAIASQLNPNFAAPHFQLYNAYRQAGRKEDAARELELFNEIKKRKAGAAVPEDPEWSYYAEIYDVAEPDQTFDAAATSPPLTFQPVKIASGVDAATAGMAVLDFDADGHPDLLVWSKNGVLLLKNGTTPVAGTGLEDLKGVVSIAPGDFNNDGLPDLAVVTHSGATLYINRNGKKFEPSPVKLPAGKFRKAVWLDYDHDYDLDLFLLGDNSVLLRNEGEAGFSDQTEHFPFAAGLVTDAVRFELDPNTNELDLAVLYEPGSLVVYRDRLLGVFEAQPAVPLPAPAVSLLSMDINNDGWSDLLVMTAGGPHLVLNDQGKLIDRPVGAGAAGPMALADFANRSLADLVVGNRVYRNVGKGKFEPAAANGLLQGVALAQADFDGDGRSDLGVVDQNGSVYLLKNTTTSRNRSLSVRLEGVKNPKIPIGAEVEVKTGAWYQKRAYEGTPLLFGIRDYAQVDTVRITWPNGLVQNETQQKAVTEASYKEKPRLSGSCPMIFVWNGSRFDFVTDVLGVAPLGASSGDGQYFPVNHREDAVIPRTAIRTRQGMYEFRITEELREVSYLDQVLLLAVDHPAGEDLLTSDKFKSPPFPEFRLYGVRHKIHPIQARDQLGHNVRPELLESDGRYVNTFRHNSSGVAQLHTLDLDFGNVAPDNRAILVLSGWVDWADGSTFFGASQESKEGLIFPYLQVKDASGRWQTVVEDMGIPSGKPKGIVVDLTGKFLSASREVRIVTNLCVYWDEIYLSGEVAAPQMKVTQLTPRTADLRYRGFSKVVIDPARVHPEQFDYQTWAPTTGWNPTPGLYTRYGDVQELLEEMDDRMVIMGSGDELRLGFAEKELPQVPAGWTRDFILLVDGWAKDADANTASSRSVEPLPFHGMSSYPYPSSQHFPDDPIHRKYQEDFNTRSPFSDLVRLRGSDQATPQTPGPPHP
jgi:Tfp pilus assembly protein PilF